MDEMDRWKSLTSSPKHSEIPPLPEDKPQDTHNDPIRLTPGPVHTKSDSKPIFPQPVCQATMGPRNSDPCKQKISKQKKPGKNHDRENMLLTKAIIEDLFNEQKWGVDDENLPQRKDKIISLKKMIPDLNAWHLRQWCKRTERYERLEMLQLWAEILLTNADEFPCDGEGRETSKIFCSLYHSTAAAAWISADKLIHLICFRKDKMEKLPLSKVQFHVADQVLLNRIEVQEFLKENPEYVIKPECPVVEESPMNKRELDMKSKPLELNPTLPKGFQALHEVTCLLYKPSKIFKSTTVSGPQRKEKVCLNKPRTRLVVSESGLIKPVLQCTCSEDFIASLPRKLKSFRKLTLRKLNSGKSALPKGLFKINKTHNDNEFLSVEQIFDFLCGNKTITPVDQNVVQRVETELIQLMGIPTCANMDSKPR